MRADEDDVENLAIPNVSKTRTSKVDKAINSCSWVVFPLLGGILIKEVDPGGI